MLWNSENWMEMNFKDV